jgi:hypothetical protein
MTGYAVLCTSCEKPATHKVAAKWSDGATEEMKTYYLSCEGCLAIHLESARVKRTACRLAEGETLGEPQVLIRN